MSLLKGETSVQQRTISLHRELHKSQRKQIIDNFLIHETVTLVSLVPFIKISVSVGMGLCDNEFMCACMF